MMKIAILGGSGFIGSQLTEHLIEKGHQVVIWTRSPEKIDSSKESAIHSEKWPLTGESAHPDIDAVVNLAGETINQRWTPQAKERILRSRIETTRALVEIIESKKISPRVLVNGSAIGYYGTSQDLNFTEENERHGSDFLAQVCKAWEKEADQAKNHDVRVVKSRFGVVLGRDGGALPNMLFPYKLFAGGRVGTGQQWMSWVHIDDVVNLLTFALENEALSDALNCTSPHPVRMNQFGRTAGKTLGKPHWLPAPAFAIRLLLGEMSDLILKGQHVLPQKALEKGYSFKFPKLEEGLQDLLLTKKEE
jgi:uncharacterized protein (TIGR01777 family)